MLATLLNDPTGLFEISMPECFLAFAAVVARVVKGCEFLMPGFVDLDSSCLDVLFQKVVNRDDFVFLENLREPVLQTKPGRIVSVPSLGQQERFTIQPLHVLHNASY